MTKTQATTVQTLPLSALTFDSVETPASICGVSSTAAAAHIVPQVILTLTPGMAERSDKQEHP